MFVGTLPYEVLCVLHKCIGTQKREIFVGCSGNYTFDKLAATLGHNVHSNDVALYSLLVSDILLQQDVSRFTVRNEQLKQIFESWSPSRFRDFISVLFAIKVSQFAKQKNDYQCTMWNNYMEAANEYYTGTIEKFERNKTFEFKIADFYYGDFIEFIKEKKGKGIGLMFPPTYKGGYEKMYEFIEDTFEYEPAKYAIFDPKQAATLFQSFLETDENIIFTDRPHENLEPFLKSMVHLGKGKHDIYIYSSVEQSQKYYIESHEKIEPQKRMLVDENFVFDEKTEIAVEVVKTSEVTYYKQLFMALKVNYSSGGDFGIIFYANGKAFGFAAFKRMGADEDKCFLHSDFISTSNQPRLSKLVLYLLLSKEIQQVLSRKYMHYFQGIYTTVYTDKPVSMKYRGVFNLQKRKKAALVYEQNFSSLSVKENYQKWLKATSKK